MDIGNIRDFVAAGYRGDKWKNKVNRMSDQQVIAIYHSMQRRKEVRYHGNTRSDNRQIGLW
ncbi:MAG: hypothetical protein GXY14_03850 [Spirochaetes bacterium]|nr:hypothetical protein [Spirochaetota bacterium]